MSYVSPRTWTTGEVVTAAMMNGVRDTLLETAPAKVTTAGDLIVGTGANAVTRLAAVASGQVLKSNGVGAAPVWGAPAATELSPGTALYLLRTNAAGTAPEWFTPPACRVYHSANQSVSSGASLILAFNSERFDNATMHDTSTNNSRLTAPVAGVYAISLALTWENGTGEYQIAIRLNGTTYIAFENEWWPAAATSGPAFAIATAYKLAASDYVEVYAYQATGAARNIQVLGNYSPEFAMTWLGPG